MRAGRWRRAVRGASLRTRVMAVAAFLVALTCLVTAVLGTTLLRSYLLSRSDAQLRDFAKVASRIVQRQQLQPGGDSSRPQALPTQFVAEVIGVGGQISMAGGPLGAADGPRLSAAQLSDTGTPFSATAVGGSGNSWRVLVQRLSGGRHLVIAYSLGDLNSTVTRLEIANAAAGAVCVVLLAEYGLQQDDAASREELLRLMSLIAREADRMGRLVADLLLLARYDAGRPLDRWPVDLASLAAEAVTRARIVDPGRAITLEAAEPVIVDADEERLRQVIDNLMGNALQHTPPGSPVTVTVTGGPGRGQLTVADQGPGMTAEQASRVFERFYRTDGARTRGRGGAGLGLAIAASLAAAHGGDITVDTAPGRGAAFHVRLPLAGTFQVSATGSQGQVR